MAASRAGSGSIDDRLLAARGTRPPPDRIPARQQRRTVLSAAQHAMWQAQRTGRGGVTHFVLQYRLKGELDHRALDQAVGELHRRHDILRTVFQESARGIEQVVTAPGTVLVERITPPDPTDVAGTVRRLAERPYRPADVPPVRWTLLRLGASEHILLLCLHHLLADAGSEQVLQSELAALYTAFSVELAPGLPAPEVQYADFAAWQHARAAEGRDRELAYWRRVLQGAPPAVRLPFDRPPTERSGYRGATWGAEVPPAVLQGLRQLALSSRTTLAATLTAAYAQFLAAVSGQSDIVLGAMRHSRDRPELVRAIGVFAHLVPLRIDIARCRSFRELLTQVRDVTLDACAHQETPIDQVCEAAGAVAPEGRPALVQTACYHHDASETEELRLPGLSVTREQLFTDVSTFDLSLAVETAGAGARCLWEYRTELFDPATVQQLHHRFVALLAAVTADPDRPSSQGEQI
ncbi:hypothetical protein H9Y04_40955 [Streptomyces sp. TRM66268-LWL]|uniref:Condensation domain-containing protein n=1 Tax=Streptomyces polyasparticus TaxID=2767826 RepID=A0ABR7SW91_9ACTN|nr:condensation domain-containing protein [Streptomyces polyasparticus]MBC9718915.1 hypothetical protein [Streptomyces polyasparticus]